eukprot:Pgem_evm1s705
MQKLGNSIFLEKPVWWESGRMLGSLDAGSLLGCNRPLTPSNGPVWRLDRLIFLFFLKNNLLTKNTVLVGEKVE